jgi:hypothetical protein
MDGLKKYNTEHNIDVNPLNMSIGNSYSSGVGIGNGYDHKYSKPSSQSANVSTKHHQQHKHTYNQQQPTRSNYHTKAYHHGSSLHSQVHKVFYPNGSNNPHKNLSHQPPYRHSTNSQYFVEQHYPVRFNTHETSTTLSPQHAPKNQSNGPNTQVSMSPSFSCVRSGSNFGGQQNQKFPKKSKNYSNRNAKANSQLNAFSTPFRHPRQQYHTGGFDWDMTHKPNNEVSQGVENVAPLPSHLSTSIGTFAATSSSSSMSSANSNFYSRDS